MLANAGTVILQDLSSPRIAYLVLQPNNPANWPSLFGVLAQPNAGDPTRFDLSVVYDPASGGVGGVALPVTVESFTDLVARRRRELVNPDSELIVVESFADAPDATPLRLPP